MAVSLSIQPKVTRKSSGIAIVSSVTQFPVKPEVNIPSFDYPSPQIGGMFFLFCSVTPRAEDLVFRKSIMQDFNFCQNALSH